MKFSRDAKMFTVEGSGHFPFDMLRYDACWPFGHDDVERMLFGIGENEKLIQRKVRLLSHYSPTADRWKSFTWRIVANQ